MIVRDLDPELHDLRRVAELIYDVDYRTFDYLFKSKESGVDAITNRLIYAFQEDVVTDELFKVFFDDEDSDEKEIIGMFNGGKGVVHHYFKDILWLFKKLKFSQNPALQSARR